VLLEAPVGQITAVTGQDFGLRQSRREAALVGITEEKLAGLECGTRARGRYVPDSLDSRRSQSISISEMFVRLSQRRDCFQVQRRNRCHIGKPRGVLLVLLDTSLALRHIASEKDDDGVKVRT